MAKKKGKKTKKTKKVTKKMTQEELNEEIRQNRPDIEDCEDYDDLFQNYWVDELKEFCKKNGIKSSGKKTELINRILNFRKDSTDLGFKPKKKRRGGKKRKREEGEEEKEEEPAKKKRKTE